MSVLAWSESLSVGVPVIDADHRLLIDLINAAGRARDEGTGAQALSGILFTLVNYTVVHFGREERLLERFGYPQLAAHRAEHETLVAQLRESCRLIEGEDGASRIGELLFFLKNWLLIHIMGTDQAYAPFLAGHEIDLTELDRAAIPVAGLGSDSGETAAAASLGDDWFVWNEAMSVGVPAIDADHRVLIGLIRTLKDAVEAGQGSEVVDSVLNALVDYTRVHFAREEGLMERLGYPETGPHQATHDLLVRQVEGLVSLRQPGAVLALDREVLLFLKHWLNTHILGTDMRYKDFFAGKVVDLEKATLEDVRSLVAEGEDEGLDDWDRLYQQ